jgi:ribulose-5-phosphate 4-epimerase/fuculose-1-phosphate aldolase
MAWDLAAASSGLTQLPEILAATTRMKAPRGDLRTMSDQSNSNQKLRAQVAAATRIMVMEDLIDYSGHVSVRVPGRNAFFIQPGIQPRSDVTADSLLMVGFDGKVIEGNARPPVEIPIHIEIYKARPDVQAIVHSHMELAIMFTMMEGVQLKPMRARAIRWRSGIPMDDDPSHIKTTEQGVKLARALGHHHACLMRAHGSVLVAESVPALLVDAVHFDENARAQMTVLQAGREPKALTDTELEMIDKHEMREFHVDKLWRFYTQKGIRQGVVDEGENLIFD